MTYYHVSKSYKRIRQKYLHKIWLEMIKFSPSNRQFNHLIVRCLLYFLWVTVLIIYPMFYVDMSCIHHHHHHHIESNFM